MKRSTLLLLGIILTVTVVAVFLVIYLRNSGGNTVTPEETAQPVGDTIMKVGAEEIYQADYNYERSLLPGADTAETKEQILNKIRDDSVILQQGQKEGLIELNASIFNSPGKDYTKRVEAIENIRTQVESKSSAVKGSVISIWFRNNDYIGPKGLEGSKKIAYDKISALQKKIAAEQLTMLEAGKAIAADTSLAQVDTAYRNNAYYEFDATANQPISISPEFDTILRSQEVGAVTDVFLAKNKDVDPEKQYEALYYVGLVTEKNQSPSLDFDTWLGQARSAFPVVN